MATRDLRCGILFGPERAGLDNDDMAQADTLVKYPLNPEFDSLIDQYFVTIPRAERTQLAGRIVEHLTSQVIPLGLFYDAAPVVIGNRLTNVIPRMVGWNAHEWQAR